MSNRAIVITGVSTGIGLGCAQAFLRAGYRVYGSVRKPADGERLEAELGENFRALLFDITDEAAVAAAAKSVESELGGARLEGLINNAGIATSGPVMLQPLDEIRQQFEINVIGQLIVSRAFLSLLEPRPGEDEGGRIIMVSSVSAMVSGPFLGAYSASKRALDGITHSLRRELMLHGVDVIIVGPGKVASAIWDKDSAQNIEPLLGTRYEDSARKMQHYAVTEGKKGETIEEFGRQVRKVFEARNPKARYALVKDKIENWWVPLALPARVLDKVIAKKFSLGRK